MEKLYDALLSVGLVVRYGIAGEQVELPYISYMDYAERYKKADNRNDEAITSIQVDFFTKIARDENAQTIKAALDNAEIPFNYKLLYEKDEKVYHHIYDCEVV